MRLEYIKVKNFGIHQEAEARLEDGFVVVRGGNGKGKSTLIIQSILYALFGASTLEATLDDTVTRGEKVSSLQVEAKYGPYIVRRSKSSASVVGNGITTSGQAEVSEFFHNLFGIQKGTESLVLVAQQGIITGILNGKPVEVNSFIESLAGFDQIDDLITRVKLKYPTGQKATLEDRLETLKDRKEELDIVEIPSVEKLGLSGAEKKKVVDESSLQMLRDIFGVHNMAIIAGTKHNAEVEKGQLNLQVVKAQQEEVTERITELNAKLADVYVYDQGELDSAEELIASLDKKNKEWAAYEWMTHLKPQENEWEGDVYSFTAEMKKTADLVRELTTKITEGKAEARSKKNQIVIDKTCTLCGQDVEHLHEEINNQLTLDIDSLELSIAGSTAKVMKLKANLNILNNINNEQIRRDKPRFTMYMSIDTDMVPWDLKWSGENPSEPNSVEVKKASDLLGEYKSTQTLINTWKNRLVESALVAGRLEETLPAAQKILDDLDPEIDISYPEGMKKETQIQIDQQDLRLNKTIRHLNDIKVEIARIKILKEENTKAITQVKEDIKNTNRLLKEDGKNGKILKSVRDAKPKVLELVWSRILVSVSTTFSDMVSKPTTVEKDTKGFRINGLPVARLSGSEKTTLGIALRAALRDIFAPTAEFLLWDEPMADCDSDRAAAVIGTIQNISGQNIIVTHEDASSFAADQIIEIQ